MAVWLHTQPSLSNGYVYSYSPSSKLLDEGVWYRFITHIGAIAELLIARNEAACPLIQPSSLVQGMHNFKYLATLTS